MKTPLEPDADRHKVGVIDHMPVKGTEPEGNTELVSHIETSADLENLRNGSGYAA